MNIKAGDLIIIKRMWMDDGDLEPLLHILQTQGETVEFMVLSGRQMGLRSYFKKTMHDIEVIA